jgi:hypothetical protein
MIAQAPFFNSAKPSVTFTLKLTETRRYRQQPVALSNKKKKHGMMTTMAQ